jgi:hypothetical protein
MTRRIPTLASLARWRLLGERLAADQHARRRGEERASEARHATRLEQALALQTARAALAGDGLLDLDRVHWLGQLDEAAWLRVDAAAEELEHARHASSEACMAHASARTQTRVANDALSEARHAAADSAEKRAFDQLSDMRVGRLP